MAYSNSFFEILFLLTVTILWIMIFYQVFFTFMGFLYRSRSQREKRKLDSSREHELQPVSILVPAHNEEQVIVRTLDSLSPKKKLPGVSLALLTTGLKQPVMILLQFTMQTTLQNRIPCSTLF